ncbi:MAG: hypothetical protein JXN63_08785 [Candidatus Delongbacteria bacterium]|nr:hypothetical protein [Candidatus Delongbacteria bacterium]
MEEKSRVSEDLNGLLRFCKPYNTYFKILVSKEKKIIQLCMSGNPLYFRNIESGKFEGFTLLSRNDLNLGKLFINYLEPRHLIYNYGQTLGIHFPLNNVRIENMLDEKTKNYYMLEGPIKFLPDIISRLHDLVEMKPQVKYEIIEKFMVANS